MAAYPTEFCKIKMVTVGDTPFELKLSRTFMALACLCADCYTWIKWPTDLQTASFGEQKYTRSARSATRTR